MLPNIGSNQAASEGLTSPGAATVPAPADPNLNICSQLDFAGVIWPMRFKAIERRAMALSLNITGSFEGSGGWSNLGNNFDGQGFSLGLNQQNLGQGTLQLILKSMLDQNRPVAEALFSSANSKSLGGMISAWSESASAADIINAVSEKQLFSDEAALNALDEGFSGKVSIFGARENVSVAWAVATVYQSDHLTFKSDWKKSLQSFAATAPFRSLQVNASNSMFAKASAYFSTFKFHELRSLLLMYDFVVQNGGFTTAQMNSFRQFDAFNPKVSESTRLLKLLEIRLVSVKAQYRADVSARKKAIIDGTGTVHGTVRNLQSQYCYRSSEIVSVTP